MLAVGGEGAARMNGQRSGGVSLRKGVLLLGALLSLLAWSSARGAAFSIERVNGLLGAEPAGRAGAIDLDQNGRFIALTSTAPNLITSDTSNGDDVFVADRSGGATVRVSLDEQGGEVLDFLGIRSVSVSADGRYVAFESRSPYRIPDTIVSNPLICVGDRETGIAEIITHGIGGQLTDNASFEPTISADGRYVAYLSLASNLVPGDDDFTVGCFVYDRTARTTERVLTLPDGYAIEHLAFSRDGNWIAFSTTSDALLPSDRNSYSDIYVRNWRTGATERVSTPNTPGLEANHNSDFPAISADGRYVAFISTASNLTADFPEPVGYFIRDRLLRTTTKLSIPLDGVPRDDYRAERPAISDSGRYVAFVSISSGLVPGDTNNAADVFVRDLVIGTTARLSRSIAGAQANQDCTTPAISGNGKLVGFISGATNLVSGDTNQKSDAFVAQNPFYEPMPFGNPDSYSVTDGQTLTVPAPGLLANDSDPEDLPLFAVSPTTPQHGTLTLQANGGFTYIPTRGYAGPDNFSYYASNGTEASPAITVSITVLPAPPTISDVANRTTAEDTSTGAIPFTVGDLETPATSLSVSGASSNTTLVPNSRLSFSGSGTNRTVTITPAANQSGTTTITLTVSDGTATASDTFVLTVTAVNDPPTAQNDGYSVVEDGTLTIVPPGVLANDTDVEGNSLTAAKLTSPAHGTLSFSANGAFTYQPDADYRGPDSFTYRANDGLTDSSTALVNLTVTPVNDPPSAAAQAVTTPEDTPRATTLAGTDVDGDPLTYTIVSSPAHGTLSGSGATRTYTPAANYYGADSFTYRVSDGTLSSDPVTVTITIDAVNDPPTTTADAYTVNKNLTLQVPAPGVLGNDQDAEGDPFTAELAQAPAHGTLSLAPTGAFVYTAAAGFEGGDQFKYRATDGITASQLVVVNLTVTGMNNPPVATNITLDVDEDTTKSFELPASDPDGGTLTYLVLTQPTHGKLTGNGVSRSYQPHANYSGPDTLVFQATDGQAVSERATVTFNVRPVNDPPTAEAGPDRTVNATGPTTPVTLNGSGADVEPEPLAYAWSLDGTVRAPTAQATVSHPPGVHHLLLTVTDVDGASASDMVAVTVQDTTPPTVTCPGSLSVAASLATGAVVTYAVAAVDAVSSATVTCTPPSGSVFPEGVTVVNCTATDAAGNQASCTFRVTVAPPASTAGKVTANGAIPVTGGSGKLKVSVTYKAGGAVKGSVSFTDPVTRKAIKSSSLTALVISGTRARIFGTTRLSTGATARFIAEAEDLGTTPGVDRFRLELSDGRVFGAANLSKGSVSVTR